MSLFGTLSLSPRCPTLSVIIVNWNAGAALKQCVDSVLRSTQSAFHLASVILIDNASSLVPLDRTLLNEPSISIVENLRNVGFAKGCNQGASLSDAEYLLFLNPDVTVLPSTIDRSAALLSHPANSSVGICGVQLSDPSGAPSTCCARLPTLRSILAESAGLTKILNSSASRKLLTGDELKSSQIVDQIIGAFFLVRASVFRELSGFDERYFMYYEEVDFSLRAGAAGHTSFYLSEASAKHVGGGCSRSDPARRLAYSIESRLLFTQKHFGLLSALVVGSCALMIELPLRTLSNLRPKGWRNAQNTILAYRHLLIRLLTLVRNNVIRRQKFTVNGPPCPRVAPRA